MRTRWRMQRCGFSIYRLLGIAPTGARCTPYAATSSAARSNWSRPASTITAAPHHAPRFNEEICMSIPIPDNAEAISKQAGESIDAQRFEEAVACYDRALEINPRLASARYNEGDELAWM